MKNLFATGLSALFIIFLFSFRERKVEPVFEFQERLSSYHFFSGKLADLQPASGVVPYDLNTPLFSNYAEKARFIKLPHGEKAIYNDSMHFELPTGTVLIKNFYYPHDFRKPEQGRNIIETRLLVLVDEEWKSYAYIWNEEQTDAIYEPAGDIREIEYTDANGKKIRTKYIVPSQPQCKGCHTVDKALSPIGIAARHLNRDYNFGGRTQNQLQYWQEHGMIELPSSQMPANVVWNQLTSGTVEQRARAYLDINCGHCHHPTGIANTSGLILSIHETNPTHIGIHKTPVAAGRGSGNLKYNIEPGFPQKSIMIFRMTTTDPGIAMPEIGREQIHKEGVELISQWIREMK